MTKNGNIKEHTAQKAGEWLSVVQSGTADTQTLTEFDSWLHEHQDHMNAYAQAEQVWRDLSLVSVLGDVDVATALQPSRAAAFRVWFVEWVMRPFKKPAGLAVGMASLALVIFSVWSVGEFSEFDGSGHVTYATDTAETRELLLEDGSMITLGAKSTILTDFSFEDRRVALIAGEAFFSINKDPSRPFFVTADETIVRVVGTQFEVKQSAEKIHIVVLEGVVEVILTDSLVDAASVDNTSDLPRQALIAGQKVVTEKSKRAFDVVEIAPDQSGAWRSGFLVYEDASLVEVIADVNRYSEIEIRLGEPSLGDIRITTAFGVDQIDQMLAGLEGSQPIRLDRSAPNQIVLRRSRNKS